MDLLNSRYSNSLSTATTSKAYAIIGTPRCGSHFLCEALTSTGLAGAPIEHLRSEREMRRRERGFDANICLRTAMEKDISQFGIFGTKIISHYLIEHMQGSSQLGDTLKNFRFIRIERNDKLGQAISALLASKTGRWHIQNEQEEIDHSNRLEDLTITGEDFRTIRRFKQNFNSQELYLDSFFQLQNSPLLVISYEELDKDPRVQVQSVLRFLEISYEDILLTTSLKRTRSALSEHIRSRCLDEGLAD